MSNRTKCLDDKARVDYVVDPLIALMDSCRRNGRPAKFPPKTEKIFFDADRFRFYFQGRDDMSLQWWRDKIDAEMREFYAKQEAK